MNNVAINPRTGEVVVLSPEGDWRPAPRARNPQTGEEVFYDGTDWRPVPAAPQPQDTRGERFLIGLTDLPTGGAQFLTNNLPRGVVDAVNDATAWVNRQPVIGPITRTLGMTPLTPEQANQNVAQREAAYRDARQRAGLAPEGFDAWRTLGGIASTAPGVLASAPATLPRAVLSGAITGAGLGAMLPIDAEEDEYTRRLNNAIASGALFGAAGGAAGNLIGRALAPRIDPRVQRLHDAGVELTPGQVIGGTTKKLEDQLTSFPLGIDTARRRGFESFNRAVANEVLAPIGKRVPDDFPVGRDLLRYVEDVIKSAYKDAHQRVPALQPDQQFARDLQRIASTQFLTPDASERFRRAMTLRILPRLQGSTIDADTFQKVTSELNRFARSYEGHQDTALRDLADVFNDTHKAFFNLLERRAPDAAERLRAVNHAYAGLVRMQAASGMQGATEGVFTPAQLSFAVRQADPSLRRTAYARGDALLQELSDAARAVLPQSVPDSGTAGREFAERTLAAVLAGGAATGTLPIWPLAAFLASQALYSRPVNQAIVNAMVAPRPTAVTTAADLIRRMSAPATVPLGAMVLTPPQASPEPVGPSR